MVSPPTEPHPIGTDLHHIPGPSTSPSPRGSNGRFHLVLPVFLRYVAIGKTQNQRRDVAGMFFCNPENRLLGRQPTTDQISYYGVLRRRNHLHFRIDSGTES